MGSTIENREQILSTLHSQQEQLKGMGAQWLGLFGSFAKGKQKKDSDIDILIEFQQGQKNYRNFIHIAYFLEDLFQREVELITPQSLSPIMREQILKDALYVSIVD